MTTANGLTIRNQTVGTTVADQASMANTFATRLVGLLGRSRLANGEGLALVPCQAVHTLFMRFPIDLIFADRHLRVVQTTRALAPYRQSVHERAAWCVIELPVGAIAASRTAVGDQLLFLPE